jgi:hypothetical protein
MKKIPANEFNASLVKHLEEFLSLTRNQTHPPSGWLLRFTDFVKAKNRDERKDYYVETVKELLNLKPRSRLDLHTTLNISRTKLTKSVLPNVDFGSKFCRDPSTGKMTRFLFTNLTPKRGFVFDSPTPTSLFRARELLRSKKQILLADLVSAVGGPNEFYGKVRNDLEFTQIKYQYKHWIVLPGHTFQPPSVWSLPSKT